MATRQGVSRRPPKIEGGHFGLRATSAWIARPHPSTSPTTHLRSPSTHPHSGWVLVKAASEEGEWEVSSPQFSVLFSCP